MDEQESPVTVRDKIVGVFFDTDFALMEILDDGSERGTKLFNELEKLFNDELEKELSKPQ